MNKKVSKFSSTSIVRQIFKLANSIEWAGIKTKDSLAFKISEVLDDAVVKIIALAEDGSDEDLMMKKLRQELAAFQERQPHAEEALREQFKEEPKYVTLSKIYIDPDDEPIQDADKIYLKDDPDEGGRYPLFKGKNRLLELKESGEIDLNRPLPEELYELITVGKKRRRGYVPERKQRVKRKRF